MLDIKRIKWQPNWTSKSVLQKTKMRGLSTFQPIPGPLAFLTTPSVAPPRSLHDRYFNPALGQIIEGGSVLKWPEARIVARNTNCMTHADSRVASLLLRSQPRRFTSARFVE